jgi:hypothetical protein
MNKILVITLGSFLLAACSTTPTGQVEAFGMAAEQVTSDVDIVLREFREAGIQQEIIALSHEGGKLTLSSLQPLNKQLIKATNYKKNALVRANKELNLYAKSLVALANSGSREEYSQLALNLSTSITGMNEQYKVLSDNSKDIVDDQTASKISRVVGEIGYFYTQNKRAEALREIIVNTDDAVQELGKIIDQEFLRGLIERKLYQVRAFEFEGILADYNAGLSKTTIAQRQAILANIKNKYINLQASTASVEQARVSVKSVMSAHGILRKELENNDFNSKSILRAVSDIKEVHGSFDDIEELVSTCKTEIVADSSKGMLCKP